MQLQFSETREEQLTLLVLLLALQLLGVGHQFVNI